MDKISRLSSKFMEITLIFSVSLIMACKHETSKETSAITPKDTGVVEDGGNPGNFNNQPENLANLNFTLVDHFPTHDFDLPIAMFQSQQGDWFVVEQKGVIFVLSSTGENKRVFLDIQDRVQAGGERGLLGLALDPNFTSNGFIYVSYTSENDESIISLFSSSTNIADPNSEQIVLKVAQPYSNHNGGQIGFGPDNLLYIGLGDGGSGGDPKGHGQNKDTLLGSMLRIDVSQNDGSYDIPNNNPFLNTAGRDEIFAFGLRNPWRWSFDTQSGELWSADVGQNAWEEINILKSGKNYGWNITEGNNCYAIDNCDQSEFEPAIFEYPHGEGYSVTGGYVYRGEAIEPLKGYYIYGDYVTKKIWALIRRDNEVNNRLILQSDIHISSFAQNSKGEIFVIAHQRGKIYKLTRRD